MAASRGQLNFAASEGFTEISEKTLCRYRAAVRVYLGVRPYNPMGESLVSATITQAALTMSDPTDLINRAIEELGTAGIDLPAFSTLDRLAGNLRAQIHSQMYVSVASRLIPVAAEVLDGLLIVPTG